jgi:ACS family tartrate transporter-like MFS transporter
MMLVRTPIQFYVVRFLLGVAEAGFFPGVLYYLSQWFPMEYRARAIAAIVIGIPLSGALGGPLGGALLGLSGVGHLSGWQWLFLVEGLPPVFLGVILLGYLTEQPEDARWLSPEQRGWLSDRLIWERQQTGLVPLSPLRALANPLVWLLTVPYFALYAVSLSYTLWAPILVRDALGTSNAKTGFIVGGISLLSATVYPLAGILSDRWDERAGLASFALALGCAACVGVGLFSHSLLRVTALAFIPLSASLFMSPFWCLPTKFLNGTSAAAGIGLISAIGSSGGFFGPSILGFLKQRSGSDAGAFFGLAGLALLGSLVCAGLRQKAIFRPAQRLAAVNAAVPD